VIGEELTTMPRLTLEVTDAQAQRLAQLAAEQKMSVEQMVLEQLASVLEPSSQKREERYEEFLRSGLFVEVPDEDRRRYQPVSEERLKELAAKLGAAGPLSEVIIEERGKV
jgi:hypothetical protein